MRFGSLALGGALALALALPAQAQELIDGSQVEEILNIARGYGSATLEKQDSGDPRIRGKINGIQYVVIFKNCENNTNCEDFYFYSLFTDNKQTLETINAWNRDRRFSKAYLDADLDTVIEFDVNIEYGVSQRNLDAAFDIWSQVLDSFSTYIGFK